ncbi:uncharacterized protein LOC121240940 [Juglans microcarpa x Juglans regia]|uniref:uncharacterized protein LOC121240940 n=1 Tax=Juglans microcarpa x Juglans regia TaxID=2249226 RepID=UPI001B7E218D|nr:uncharacterized protein LOC121240940 [Juglans microcarpa x Juglans regia]
MKCLTWNCRGLGNLRTVRELHFLVKQKGPNILFLIETKSSREGTEQIRNSIGFDRSFTVNAKGSSGGLAMMWNSEMDIEVLTYTSFHISVQVKNSNLGKLCTIIGFYEHPVTAKREGSWQLLRLLQPKDNIPWLCMGDFNEIMYQHEKWGGAQRSFTQMQGFKNALQDSDLCDLGYHGIKYTWSNNRAGSDFTKERLDRVCANTLCITMFPSIEVSTIASSSSGHYQLLTILNTQTQPVSRKERLFRYEYSWGSNNEGKELISTAWHVQNSIANSSEGLKFKMLRCKTQLLKWSKTKEKEASDSIKVQQDKIANLQARNTGEAIAEIQQIKRLINWNLEQEEVKWKQMSKQRWLKEGDRNTSYFHKCASQRRKTNTINNIYDGEGHLQNSAQVINQIFQDFFKDLFSTSNPVGQQQFVETMPRVITDEMNHMLQKDFEFSEV